jgi:hypothetical protein
MLRRSYCLATLALVVPHVYARNETALEAKKRHEWLAKFYKTQTRSSTGPLRLQKFSDDMYIVLEPISWRPSKEQPADLPSVTVPFGFVTDLASVPAILFSVLRPDGPYGFAAIIHDYLYWEQRYPKDVADRVFDFAMRDFKVSTLKRTSIVTAVKTLGVGAWKENAKLRESGERRLLKLLPSDPRTSWAEWKKTPKVFAVHLPLSRPSP